MALSIQEEGRMVSMAPSSSLNRLSWHDGTSAFGSSACQLERAKVGQVFVICPKVNAKEKQKDKDELETPGRKFKKWLLVTGNWLHQGGSERHSSSAAPTQTRSTIWPWREAMISLSR